MKKRITFDECAEQCILTKKAEWKGNGNELKWRNTIANYVSPHIGSMHVSDIDVRDVLRCLEPIWLTKTVTATRIRSRIENILSWAGSQDYRSKENNPARWSGHLEHALPKPRRIAKVKHRSFLPYKNTAEFTEKLRAVDSVPAQALEFTILTAARSQVTLGATWNEIDIKEGVWSIPAHRTKSDRDHRIPLSPRAIEILNAREQERTCALVFTVPGKTTRMSKDTMTDLLERMERDDITVHGFRSTFRTWSAEVTHCPRDVCEMALAHRIKDETEAAYQHGDLFEKRRQLMNDWATYCATERREGGNVVPMQRSNTAA